MSRIKNGFKIDIMSGNEYKTVYADFCLLASGGIGRVYKYTTNPSVATGDGIRLAYEMGAAIKNLSYVQFHPTAFNGANREQFLISEAVRGEGAHLLDKRGKRFMVPIHELAELAPRDIVARSIFKQMIKDDVQHVTLSLRHLNREKILKRFPGIHAKCQEYGHDLTQEIPVAPAAHYSVGGVLSNSNGRTDVERLYVCGEVAATGIMGANRLASNSLIECLVFANRAVEDTVKVGAVKEFPDFAKQYSRDNDNAQLYAELKQQVSDIMNAHAGIIRSEEGLKQGLQKIEQLRNVIKQKQDERGGEQNREYYLEASRRLLCVARLIMSPALLREESRGGHYREDFPCADEAFALHSVQRRGEQITTAPVNSNYFNF
jgi:L-aspartate oxidase